MFNFRRITLFCLEKRLSKHKMTIFSKNLGGHGRFGPPWLRLCFDPPSEIFCVRHWLRPMIWSLADRVHVIDLGVMLQKNIYFERKVWRTTEVKHKTRSSVFDLDTDQAQLLSRPIWPCKTGVPNLFTISYHLGSLYCQLLPLLPEQLILWNLSWFRSVI